MLKNLLKKKMEAKVNGVKDAMSACVKNKKDEVQGTVDDAKIKAFQKSCEVNARKEFARNGGKLDDFEMVRKQAARKEVTAKMDSCVEAQLAKYTSLSDEDTKKTAIEEAVKKCDAESETAFLEAGGKKEQYFVEKSKAQKEKIASVLETCIADKKKSDQSKTAKKAALECDSAAKDAFLKAGGSEAKFAKEKKEATVAGLRDGLKGCVDEKEIEAESGGTTLNEAKMKEIVKACEKRAEEKFQEVGGDIKQFKVAKAQAARKQLMEKGQVCIEKYMEDNSITSPTAANYAAARKFCKDEKRKEFVKSGGDATLFVLEEEKASEEAMDNILDATIENDEDVKNATTASERKAAFTAAYTKKKNDIKSAFLQQGGDEEDFERKQLESQRKATGKSLRACMESEIGKLQKTNPSETEMKSAYATCKPAAVEEIVKRGGKEEDFDRAAAVAAQETAGEEISACMDIDVATATKEDAENKIAECKPAAKEAMNMVVGRANDGGGRRLLDTNGRGLATASIDLDTDTALEDATKSAVANVLNRCQKDAGSDAAALAKCALEAEMVYKKFGGDTDKREKSQKDGAAKMATLDRVACKKTGATDCEAKALKIYKQSGGDDDVNKASADANADKKMKADFKRNVERKGAVEDGASEFYVCMKNILGTSFKVSDFKFATSTCKPTEKTKAFSACNRFAKGDAAKIAECKGAVSKMAALLGEKTERALRNTQDGAQEEAASVLESCRRATKTTSKSDCNDKTKKAFEKAGGDKTKYAEELRQGMGKIGAEIKSACYKNANSNDGQDACEKVGKEEFAAAGGDEKDFWADQKRGNYQLALDKYKDTLDTKVAEDAEVKKVPDTASDVERQRAVQTAKSKEDYKKAARDAAKTYYTTELKGDAADFDDEEFKTMTAHADKKVSFKRDKKVEMQVRTDVSATALDGKKSSMEDSIKEAVKAVATNKKKSGVSVTVSCGKSNARGTKTNMVCKLQAGDDKKAKEVAELTRDPDFKVQLKTKFNSKGRRLKNGRHLTASVMDVESSQALTVEAQADTSSTAPGAKKPGSSSTKSRSPTPAGDDDEDILSSSPKNTVSSNLFAVAGIFMMCFLF